MDNDFKKLEEQSVFILREAKVRFKNIGILWSMGKDSTAILNLVRKAFFGRIPFPAIFIDSGQDFAETYRFQKELIKKWDINLLTVRAENKKDSITGTAEGLNKAEALKKIIDEKKFDAMIVSIRRDEHGVRSKERYFSPRTKDFKWDFKNQPPEIWHYVSEFREASHIRVHPLLHWREIDVWKYTKEENIPFNPLYLAQDGKRYRSLGYPETTVPVESSASTIEEIIEELERGEGSEREGRAQDKEREYAMQRLRELGYM